MTFPPPGPPGSGAPGGGFGPPQGFGPPEQPGPPQGFGPPGGPPPGGPPGGGYGGPGGPGGPGGYGQPWGGPPPPPPGGGNSGAKVAAIVIALVLVAAVAVGGVVLLTGDDDEDGSDEARPAGTPTTGRPDADRDRKRPGGSPSADVPGADSGGTGQPGTPGATPSDLVPFVVLDPGECFDHPALSSKVDKVETRSCDTPHNGEIITNDTLTGTFETEKQLQDKVLELCKADAAKRLKTIPQDGRSYYFYAIYPSLATYRQRGEDTISCSLTLSNALDGPKLTEPLPG